MGIKGFAGWLDVTPVSVAIKNSVWMVPTSQSIHILAVAMVFGGTAILTLRAWNMLGSHWTMAQWARRLYPAHWWAFVALLATGLFQSLAEPARELPNPVFQIKMLALLVATPMALLLARALGNMRGNVPDLSMRLAAVAMLLVWIGIIGAGRWIAYV